MPTATPARQHKAPAIAALLPNPGTDHFGQFWAVHALNDDACLQALEGFQRPLYTPGRESSANFTRRIALVRAVRDAEQKRDESFVWCKGAGGLLYAWRGSRALVQALPASLQGGAA